MSALLDVKELRVTFPTRTGVVEAVRGVSFTLGRERLGIVGESGSGKSQTGRAIMGLTPEHGRISAEKLDFNGIDLTAASKAERRALRGKRIAMILQDPKYSLNPVMSIGRQIIETLRTHEKRAGERSTCWPPCRFATPNVSSTFIRTRSPAVWASVR
jgi:peptide/nickel transport system ATP-binding protein